MLIPGGQQHLPCETPPATPSASAGLDSLRDQEAEGPGRMTGTWIRGLAKAGNSWEDIASGTERQGGVSSVVEVQQLPAGPLGHHGLQACPWERRLKEKPARAQDLLWCERIGIQPKNSPELEGDWTFVVPGMQC